ncbi:D-Ala-D-Ala carboxypeptidase family metallohydrolase [Mucilaginibacter defluvii]|uniref:Peptidase M15A C-terminal domain-containing protein n=1 Tax=Mucilaginibacter defluvii TaxID=1196019 RepID=A0ABP9FV95_9SPHI
MSVPVKFDNANAFDNQLKTDAAANRFRIEGSYIVFDKNSNLSYPIIFGYTLGDLLTKNPVASYTKLHKMLLLRLQLLTQQWYTTNGKNHKLVINSSYRSPEYNKTVPGSATNSLHTKGHAIDIGTKLPQDLAMFYREFKLPGGLGIYKWGIHIDIGDVGQTVFAEWDKTKDETKLRKLKDFLLPDTRRNYSILAVIGLLGFFIFKRITR